MPASIVSIACDNIVDWPSFHAEFAKVLGFPSYYGKSMDSWIDCMSSVDDPEDGLSTVVCAPGTVFTLQLEGVQSFKTRCPAQYEALVDCTSFVNWRRVREGGLSLLALSWA